MNNTLFRAPVNRLIALLAAVLLCAAIGGTSAYAQRGKTPTIIRDAEIETILKTWAEPVIRAADLDPGAVKFILVQDNNVNAFVAGGPNIFLFTGLLLRSESPAEIVGVIAHELGHIKGGHLVRARGALEAASYESLLGTLLGLSAAVLTGEGAVASAIVAGSRSAAQNRLLAFSRVQESSADQSALTALERAGMNPEGLVSFMKKLESQELLPSSQQNEYIRTHPLTRNRIEALEAGRARSTHREAAFPAEWLEQHARMKAKLTGFINPQQVEWDYHLHDKSVAADYARTIGAYRQNRLVPSLQKMESLLAREPGNPYFLELKGQMLTDFGRVREALEPYRQAVEKLPDAGLIRIAYAHALIESGGQDKAMLSEAVNQLQRALKDEPRTPRIHRLLATAYGRLGQESLTKLHLAEEALLKGEFPYARRQAEAALRGLEKGTTPWLRAQDILNFIEQAGEKE